LLGVPQPLRKRLQQLPADRRVPLDEQAEVPERDPPAEQIAGRSDRGRARTLVDERDLAEVVARLQRRALLAARKGTLSYTRATLLLPRQAPLTAAAALRYKNGMSEEKIVEVVNKALAAGGIDDTVIAAGEFNPRGHSGAGFAGGWIGGDIGDSLPGPAGAIGTVGGYLAGTKAHDSATGLPERMVVGASETTVYGFAGNRAHPKALAFRVPRAGLEAKVHQRVNVRVLELIDTESGSRIELEGMRLPITHSKDVIEELT
jgi:hypothetical protein